MSTKDALRKALIGEIELTAAKLSKTPERVGALVGGSGVFYRGLVEGNGVRLDRYDDYVARARALRDQQAAA